LGGKQGTAIDINSLGQVVGLSYLNNDTRHAVIWNGTTPIDLGTLGASISQANAINDPGQVVGFSYTTNLASQHAVLWDGTNLLI
jgi:probable HAF family extracellular repeat protein